MKKIKWLRDCMFLILPKAQRTKAKGPLEAEGARTLLLFCLSSFDLRPLDLRSPHGDWSSAVAEAVAEEVLQVGDRVDFLDGRFQVVLDAAEADGVVIEQDVAGARVAVAGL